MLRNRNLLDAEAFPKRQCRDEAMKISVEREGLGNRPAHYAYSAGHIMEPLIGDTGDDAMKGA